MFVACFNMHMVSFPCVLACVRRLCVVFQHRRFRRCSGKRSCRPRRVPWRLPGMRASYFMSFLMHMPHAMPRARTCEAHARSVCASSVRWHALLGAQVPVRVPFFACTLFPCLGMIFFTCMPHAMQKVCLADARDPISGPMRAARLRRVLT